MQYRVVPLIGQSRGSLSAADVARQLEVIISQHVAQGWEFCQLSDVNIEVQPGCVAGLFGARVQYVRFDQLIFKSSSDAAVSVVPNAARVPMELDRSPAIVEQASMDSNSGTASVAHSTPPPVQGVVQTCPHCGRPQGSHDILCIESMRT